MIDPTDEQVWAQRRREREAIESRLYALVALMTVFTLSGFAWSAVLWWRWIHTLL